MSGVNLLGPNQVLSNTTPAAPGGNTNVTWQGDGTNVSGYVPSGSGTVTSVALSMPAEFTVTGSPVTSSGTLAVTKANESANTVYAGPSSGSAAAPAFRSLVSADLPVGSASQLGAVKVDGTTITASAGVISAVAGVTLLTETVLGASAATISFSSIPATYRDLLVVVRGRGDKAAAYAALYVQFNGDTGNNYSSAQISGAGSAAGGQATSVAQLSQLGWVTAASSPAGAAGAAQIRIYNYRGTTFWKSVTSEAMVMTASGAGGTFTLNAGGIWASTAAITSITLAPDSGNFIAGTVASLYGLL